MNKIKVTTQKTNIMQVSQQEYNSKRIPTLIKPLSPPNTYIRVFNNTTSEGFSIYNCELKTAKALLTNILSKEFTPTESGNKVHIEIRQSKRVDGKRVFKTKTFFIYSGSVLEVVSKIKNSIK